MKTSFFRRVGAALVTMGLLAGSLPSVTSAAQTTVDFAGRTWLVKTGHMAPGPNHWSADLDAVFVDAQGRLHMKMTQRNGVWYSSEVSLPASLGYGTYQFELDTSIGNIDQNVVVAPFLYQDDTHGIDIEYSNWMSPGYWMGHYTVQPSGIKNMKDFSVPVIEGPSVSTIQWLSDKINFSTMQNGATIAQWTYTGANNFAPGNERLHFSHWMVNGVAPSDGQEQEVIIKNFTFTPASTVTASTATVTTAPKTMYSLKSFFSKFKWWK